MGKTAVKTAVKVIKTSENSELSCPGSAPMRSCKMMKKPMLPARPSVQAVASLVSVGKRDTCYMNSCVTGSIVVGVWQVIHFSKSK